MKTQLHSTETSYAKARFSSRGNLKILVFLFFNLLATSVVFATHFRYGLVTATRLSETGTTVTYRINVSEAWRLGVAEPTSSFTVSGGNSGNFVVSKTTVTDPSGGWSNSSGTVNITLNKTATPTRIEYTNCCKIAGTVNNSEGNWDEYIILNTNAPGSSPVSTLPAIINMPINAAATTYLIPASDPDAGSSLTFGTPNFTSGPLAGQTEPSGFSINPTTGQITLNTIGKSVGQLYNAMVTVTDNNGNQIMLDFIINMVGASNPPVFDYSVMPTNGFVYNVMAGQNISFPIKASDVDAGSSVGLSVSGLPAYITASNFSPALPATGNPSQTTFSWTPAGAQIGTTNVLNFIATDNVGVQTTTSVTIKVVAEPAPVFIPPSPGQSTLRQISTGVLHQDNIVAKSTLGSNVSIAFATIPPGASLSPAVPTSGANPGQTTLNWTPTPANFGQHTLTYQATISAFPTIFTTLSYDIVVNTPPVFSSSPTQLTVNAGEPFSYNVTVSDPDIPYGDVIDIGAHHIPSWLTLTSTGNGTAVLSGTPTFADGGVNSVELEAEDIYHHGNPSHLHQEFDIFVVTCLPPALTCPSNITVNATSNNGTCGAMVSYPAASVSGTNPSVTYSIPSGSLFPVGTTTVNVSAINDCGTAACSFTVTVTGQDNDHDGLLDACDLDDDNDGILDAAECNKSNFFWSNPPSVSGNTASGTINGIGYTYTSSSPVTTTTAVYNHGAFPASYGVPNSNPTIQNTQVTSNTLTFASPMTNPVLVFASIGNSGNAVPIEFASPIQVLWSQDVTINSSTKITGREGYAIIRFNGVFNSISFNYLVAENWCNFAFGADFQTCPDTDNDGVIDARDMDSDNDGCPDALEGDLNFMMSQIVNGQLTGAVGANGVPVLAGAGQGVGTSQLANANCFCQVGNDQSAPVLTAPADVNVNVKACASFPVTVALGNASATDNCAVTITNNAPSAYPLGTTTVTWTAKDLANNTTTATQKVTVTQTPALTVNSTKNINCSGPNSGSITVNAAGGNPPYSYQLNGGQAQSSNVFSNLAPGVYSVSVKDADNCTAAQNQITLTEPFCLQAVNDAYDNCAGKSITIQKSSLLGNDANPWNVAIYMDVAQPANGTIVDNGASITYTPNANFSGLDQFNYTIKKNDGTIAFAGNGHVYEWVPLYAVTWNSARVSAGMRYYNGMQGYLVTVTSQAEMNFVASKLQGSGWMGASDRAYEGTWRWVTGPEGLENSGQGRHFSNQAKYSWGSCDAATSPALMGQYANWAGGEPNDCGAYLNQYSPTDINRGGEHYAHFYGGGIWNDYPDNAGGNIQGYIVEYGGMEGPIASTGTSTATVSVNNFKVLIGESIVHETCPGAANGSITASASGGTAPYSYNWGGGITTATRTGLTAGSYSVTVTDALGCVATKTFTVNMTDNIAPIVVTQPVTAYLDANGMATITPQQVNNGSTDNCQIASLALDKTTFNCANVTTNVSGVLSAKVTVDNEYSMYISTDDNVQGTYIGGGNNWPTLYNLTAPLVAGQTYYLHVYAKDVGGAEMFIGDLSVTGDFVFINGQKNLPTNVANWKVSNNGWSNYGTPHDFGPSGTSPWGVLGALSPQARYIWSNTFTSAGNVVEDVYFSTPIYFTGASNTVLLTATDNSGNASSAPATVTILDIIAPAITCPADIGVYATSAAGASVSFNIPAATDNCSATVAQTGGLASGSTFPIGVSTVTFTATDPSGNTTNCSMLITVTGIPPVIVSPGTITVNNSAGLCSGIANYAATETTAIPASVITYSHNPGSVFPVGSTIVTATATNPVGTSSTSFTVTVVDNEAPVVLTQNLTIGLNANGTASITASQLNDGSHDNCEIESLSINQSAFNCSHVGNNTITLTVTDIHGNSASATATVTVQDMIAPTVVTQNITVQLNASGSASITPAQINNGSTDNCTIAGYSLDKTTFNCSNVGANAVVLTVTDVNGNSASANATVTVQDNIAPTVITQNITVTLVNGAVSITAAQVNNGSYDNCSIASMSVSPSAFTCANIGNNTVTLTVTDVNGNVNSANATVFVTGVIPSCSVSSAPNNSGTVIGSTVTGAAMNQMYLGYGAQSMQLTCSATGATPFTYSWSGPGLNNATIANPIFTPTAGGNFTFTCTVTNAYGCQTTCSITICVIDARVPGGNANNAKVFLCHVPPGNPNNPQTLSISINAVPAHLGNHTGDRLGNCGAVCGFSKTESTAGGELYSSETEMGEIDLVVYPNPSMEAFNFRLESNSTEEVSIVITDISGRMIVERNHMLPNEKIVIDELTTPGVYIAEVTQGSFHRTVKLTKVN